MRIIVQKYTNDALMREACEFTMKHRFKSNMTLPEIYTCEHSPMRTQQFIIRMYDIPSTVSVHFVRHATVGQQHYVGSNRPDRRKTVDPGTHTDHMMILNAQHLIDMSRKRLCSQALPATREIMESIKGGVSQVDSSLMEKMVPECHYRSGMCHEKKPCPTWKSYWSVGRVEALLKDLGYPYELISTDTDG